MTPDTRPTGGGVFRRILVGYDGSTEARHALQVAAALAVELQGTTHVLLVVRPGAHAGDAGGARAGAGGGTLQPVPRASAPCAPRASPPGTSRPRPCMPTTPARAIASYAEERGFDLVVVGGHGREQVTRRGIGRSLEALLRHHPCPVLVV